MTSEGIAAKAFELKIGVSAALSPLRAWLFPSLYPHGLRPFDRLRAGCGLYSFAASRLSGMGFGKRAFGDEIHREKSMRRDS